MHHKLFWRRAWLLFPGLLAATAAWGFVLYYDESDVYLLKWNSTPVAMRINLSTTANLLDGSSQAGSVAAALDIWNAHLGVIRLSRDTSNASGYGLGNGINEIAMDRTVDGDAFPVGTLALTMYYYVGNDIVEADIVFNSGYTWNSYRGALRRDVEEIRRVAVHELGHVLGLNHPDEAGQGVVAIMNSQVSSIENPQNDDITGLRALYGTPGVVPPNDSFANATPITLTNGARQVLGSNIGASRQTGEPGHAGATSVHSVWWSWTATGNGTLTVDTLGSNFDTVVAAYTGGSVSGLTLVAANDDEESPDQNPTPQRKRTSRIAFPVASGTVYRLAVDGWGDDDLRPEGYTGAVTLNLAFSGQTPVTPVITVQPLTRSVPAGGNVTLTVAATGTPAPTYQWQRNGTQLAGATSPSLALNDAQPALTGLYTALATSGSTTVTSSAAIVGVSTTSKVIGQGEELRADVLHPNGNIFDQVLLTGAAEAVTAESERNQITRTSFIDLDGDIVQVEFAGPGTLSLVLEGATGRAAPENYNQPDVQYMKGHASIVITGATERTSVSVFTVGRATAFDPTGAFDIVRDVSATNVPANNGSPLFVGHGSTRYDGIADLAFIAIASTNGRFGGVRTANATYFADKGFTGIYAPGVEFAGPVYVGDITGFGPATPVLVLGSANDVRITGGDMGQNNGQSVQVSGIARLQFTAGADSHGNPLPAQANRAVYLQNGSDVTAQIVANP